MEAQHHDLLQDCFTFAVSHSNSSVWLYYKESWCPTLLLWESLPKHQHTHMHVQLVSGKKFDVNSRLRLKCDDTHAETRFRLSAKRRSPFKSAGASVQSTTGSWGVRISGSNAGYTTFRGSVKGTGYPPHSPVSPSLPFPCVTVCHHISTGLYVLHYYQFHILKKKGVK